MLHQPRPNRNLMAQLSDAACDPLTVVYCLFRYRHNSRAVQRLLDRLDASSHVDLPSFALHLCHLMLVEPISQQVITAESSPNYDGVIAEWRAGGEAADRKGEYVAPLRAASLLVLSRPD